MPYVEIALLISAVVLGFWVKIARNTAKNEKLQREQAEARQEQSAAVIVEQAARSKAGQQLEIKLFNRRKSDQAKIDSGDRSAFEHDEY
jgi:hypothetical protein